MKSMSKIIAIGFFCTAAFILLIIFFASPAMSEINSINALARQRKTELSILIQQIQAFKTAQSDLEKALRKEDIENAIVVKEDLVIPVSELEAAAANSGTTLALTIKEPGPKDKPSTVTSKRKGIDEIPYEIGISNDYNGIINFLSYLEHLPHFTEISRISLTSEIVGSGTGISRTGTVFGQVNAVFFIKSPK
jgi:hypothetical protein